MQQKTLYCSSLLCLNCAIFVGINCEKNSLLQKKNVLFKKGKEIFVKSFYSSCYIYFFNLYDVYNFLFFLS